MAEPAQEQVKQASRMRHVSRALAKGDVDAAWYLLAELVDRYTAAAFLLESGVELAQLPRAALLGLLNRGQA